MGPSDGTSAACGPVERMGACSVPPPMCRRGARFRREALCERRRVSPGCLIKWEYRRMRGAEGERSIRRGGGGAYNPKSISCAHDVCRCRLFSVCACDQCFTHALRNRFLRITRPVTRRHLCTHRHRLLHNREIDMAWSRCDLTHTHTHTPVCVGTMHTTHVRKEEALGTKSESKKKKLTG